MRKKEGTGTAHIDVTLPLFLLLLGGRRGGGPSLGGCTAKRSRKAAAGRGKEEGEEGSVVQ